jgi:hypothetical protein
MTIIITCNRKSKTPQARYMVYFSFTNRRYTTELSEMQHCDKGWMIGVGVPAGAGNFSLHHLV